MKMPIKWHEEGLNNSKRSLEAMEKQLITMQQRVQRARDAIEFSTYQLESAIKDGKDGYDDERYKVKRVTKHE